MSELERLEAIISEGLETFVQVGQALMEINTKRLYREQYRTFEDYCRLRWRFSRQHAYNLIGTSKLFIDAGLSSIVDKIEFPSEHAIRELKKLPTPESRRAALVVAMTTAPEGRVTTGWMASTIEVMTDAINNEGQVMVGEQAIAIAASITEEAHNRMLRQREHIRAGKSAPLFNECGALPDVLALIATALGATDRQVRVVIYEVQ